MIRRTRVNLSDIFVSFSWIGFVADCIGHTLLHQLGLELSPSKQSTVAVNADPHKLVQVYKVDSSSPSFLPSVGVFAWIGCVINRDF